MPKNKVLVLLPTFYPVKSSNGKRSDRGGRLKPKLDNKPE